MKAKILVVEDDEEIRYLVKAFLESAGYELAEAADLATARRALTGSPSNIVLLDLKLPDGTGLDLIPELKQNWPNAKIIILTGDHSVAAAEAAYTVDAQVYLLNKPFDAGVLHAMVELALSQKPTPRAGG